MQSLEFNASLVWFRRDLRSFDHAALHAALVRSRRVYCVFVFDTDILNTLPRADRRVEFIQQSVAELACELGKLGGSMLVRHGLPLAEIPRLAVQLGVDAVFANRDYEPAARRRDAAVSSALNAEGISWHSCKDQVIFEADEIRTQAGTPYSVFTPYKTAWLKRLHLDESEALQNWEVEPLAERLAAPPNANANPVPDLTDLGFVPGGLAVAPGMCGGQAAFDDFRPRIGTYAQARNYPALKGPSYLSVHLRFGTVSLRGLVREALSEARGDAGAAAIDGASTWLAELIWRDFYFMILQQHPHVAESAFKPDYDAIRWETGADADRLFSAWCDGRTGYPLVDAAMLQLNRSGYMHNRLRMVTASFLVKNLGIDWRRGERYFAQQLNDYDLAANNGGWQWAASTGCDAQPWFRIFNPVTQSEKFDPDGRFIRRYLPQLEHLPNKHLHAPWKAPEQVLTSAGVQLGTSYPLPIVDLNASRQKTLARYAAIKEERRTP